MTGASDPVLDRRQRLARLARTGRRLGYSLYGVSLAAVAAGLLAGFTAAAAMVATATLVVGSVVLLPSIIIGYGVKAADRADQNNDW